ncbi:hypothetical protein TUM13066_40820 [Escherichia coli]|nr:conserved protein of unknown function [Escherichia coli]BDI38869.1 hypothetical protein EsCdI10290_05040 [Escherichia sp. 10290]BDI48710.1 hypothetical protein EsCd1HHP049_04910 [Escherichia sp. HH154_1D]BDI53558.1 hypothetical protein EsCd1KSP079_04960 [Escherichia sp. KS167_9B]CRL87973.1 conserved hypothetical protein [Escherichia coli]
MSHKEADETFIALPYVTQTSDEIEYHCDLNGQRGTVLGAIGGASDLLLANQ